MKRRGLFTAILVAVNLLFLVGVEGLSAWLLERWSGSDQDRRVSFVVDPHLFWRPRDYARRLDATTGRGRNVVLCLGDSVTMGLDVPAGRDYSSLLEKCLSRDDPKGWTVLNGGVEGYSTLQSLRVLEMTAPTVQPRFVALFGGWNDHWPHGRVPDKEVSATALRLRQWATGTATGRLVDRTVVHLLQHRGAWVTRVSPADFEANLGGIHDRARAAGARLVLIAPVYYGPGAQQDGVEELHLGYVRAMRAVASRRGIPVVDLIPQFRDRADLFVPDAAFREGGGVDYVHPNEAGHALLAGALCRVIGEIERGAEPPSPPRR